MDYDEPGQQAERDLPWWPFLSKSKTWYGEEEGEVDEDYGCRGPDDLQSPEVRKKQGVLVQDMLQFLTTASTLDVGIFVRQGMLELVTALTVWQLYYYRESLDQNSYPEGGYKRAKQILESYGIYVAFCRYHVGWYGVEWEMVFYPDIGAFIADEVKHKDDKEEFGMERDALLRGFQTIGPAIGRYLAHYEFHSESSYAPDRLGE